MIRHNCQQGTLAWLQARVGIPTASEFNQLLTPELKVRTGQMPVSYLAKKVAEAWFGAPLPDINSFDMEQGSILEEEAIPFYELQYNQTVDRVGFITTDDGRIGCSPDGLLHGDGGIEIKCPRLQTHIGYLLDGELPKDYAAQVHGSMFVTGAPWWKFLSYRRQLPPLLLTVERDETIQYRIEQALAKFLSDFDEAMARLAEINGGPPPKRTKPDAPPTEPQRGPFDDDDVMP